MPKDGSAFALDGQGRPLWLVLELTYRCPLKCVWCNNPLDFERYGAHELSTEEWKDVLRQARVLGSLQLGFSGGEPMLRNDLEELVGFAGELGYYTNLITSGVGLTEKRLVALKHAGLKQIQLSIQSADRALTNELVGARAHDIKLDVAPHQGPRLPDGAERTGRATEHRPGRAHPRHGRGHRRGLSGAR